jgi:AsmA protein
MRKLGIAILVVILLCVALALIIPHVVDINSYHNQIQTQLEKKLGRQVSLGEMRLSLFPPSFQVQNAVIGEDRAFPTGRPFAEVQRLSVSVTLLPLLRKQVDINSLDLQRPRIELVRNTQGEWNFATLGTSSAPAEANQKKAGQFELAKLQIEDGQVAIADNQKHQSRAVYDHIDLTVTDFAPNREFTIEAAAHLPGVGKQTLSLKGKGGPIQQTNTLNTNFDGAMHLEQVSVSAAEKFLNSQALSGMEALVSGDAKLKNSNGKTTSNGTIKLENAQIHQVSVGYPITLDYEVADNLTTDVIEVHRADIKLGSTPITIAGTLNTRPTPAQIDLKLTAANASIAEAARLASALGVAFNPGMDVNGRVDANISARGAANQPSMNGQLSARDLVISGKDLPQPVKVNQISLALTPDTIRSNDFTASTGITTVTINFAVAKYTSLNSSVAASLRAADARLGEVLNIAKAYGVSAVEGMSGDGLLTLDVRAQGPTKNPSALTFNGTGKIQNATLKTPSLTKPVQIRNSDIRFSQNSAILENVAASVGQTNANGALTLKNFAAPQVQFTLNADKINVAELQQLVATSSPAKRTSTGPTADEFWHIMPVARAQGPANQFSMLSKIIGNGTVSIGTIVYDELLMTNAHSNVSLDHGLVKLNPVTADLYGGKEAGTITMDTRPAQPVYTVNLKTDKVDANKLISSVSSMKQMLFGLLTSNVNASFSSNSATSIMQSLNGNLALNLVNGKLANVDLLHELASLGQFMGGTLGTASKGFTNLVQLSGNFDVRNGVAQTENLKAAIDGGTFAAKGLVNLGSESLNMHITAVLNKAMSQAVGGTQIGGFMNTALANNQGELVMPIILTGTFQHPQVAPDMQQIAQMKLQNLLPTSKNPGALTNGVLGAILGKNQPSDQNTGTSTDAVSGILGALGGGKQQKRPASSQQSTAPPADADQQQQQSNPLGDVLNQVLNKKQKQQQPAPSEPPKR